MKFCHSPLAIATTLAFFLIFINASPVAADEGMWLFNALPKEQLESNYGFSPDQKWADHLMKSSVRFNVGGSASFVSSNGLVLTNHHVGSDTLAKLSTAENDYLEDGFLAASMADELKAPDLELNQLINIRDVTDQVNLEIESTMDDAAAATARRKVIGEIEQAANDESGLRSNVITLFGGGRYHLYQYKKYTDVRLVWAPESAAAVLGGDFDNFNYPRFCLDACLFRVYENDQPAEIEHFLKWSANGPEENEVIFVSGSPGSTSRIYTVDALKAERDHFLPYSLNYFRRREILLQQYSLRSLEAARQAKESLFNIQNARKLYTGKLQGLQDPAIMNAKIAAEEKLRNKITADSNLAKYDQAFEELKAIEQKKIARLGTGVRISSDLFSLARTIVQMAEEDTKESSQRMAKYRDSSRESLEQKLFSTAPIYKDLEYAVLADSISRTVELLGADSKICQTMLDGKSPVQLATAAVFSTQLDDVGFRKQIVAGGADAIKTSSDPMIKLALSVEEYDRAERRESDSIREAERQAYASIAEALFATQGTSTYPDATFTLRLAFGPVKGYELGGEQFPAWTTMGGAFEHSENHKGMKAYQMPESWIKNRDKLDAATPYNFVSTADIIGGNSGSPVVNRDLELVGLIFDGNLQSLPADYQYDDRQARSISVHSSSIREALIKIYDASHVADQLGK